MYGVRERVKRKKGFTMSRNESWIGQQDHCPVPTAHASQAIRDARRRAPTCGFERYLSCSIENAGYEYGTEYAGRLEAAINHQHAGRPASFVGSAVPCIKVV